MESNSRGNLSLNTKPLRNLFGDEGDFQIHSSTTITENNLKLLLNLDGNFAQNIKGKMTSFLFEETSGGFRLINHLSKNFFTHLSIKNKGKPFFCHINFSLAISS